jgi:hypothetical protein
MPNRHTSDGFAFEVRGDPPAGDFNFRQFWHSVDFRRSATIPFAHLSPRP